MSSSSSVPASPHLLLPQQQQQQPQFFQPFQQQGNNDQSSRFWSEVVIPMENEQQSTKMANYPEFPPFKKPRNNNFEDGMNSFPNQQNRMPLQNPQQNPPRGLGKMFFKTRQCAKYKAGTCPYGDNCNFAHGTEDVRQPPPNWQEIVASRSDDDRSGNWEEDQKIISRLKLCKKFCNGEECPYGERCNFLHKDIGKFREDPTRFRESSAISIGTTAGSPRMSNGNGNGNGSDQSDGNGFLNSGGGGGGGGGGGDGNWGLQKPVYWKTRICNKWETTGQCPFGEKCHFAHGLAELQKFGGHNEVEASNISMVTSKPVPNPASDASPSITGTACNQQIQSKKCLLKWKGTKKISRIYADWIDDMPLLVGSPTNVEI